MRTVVELKKSMFQVQPAGDSRLMKQKDLEMSTSVIVMSTVSGAAPKAAEPP
jgi:hypothetical protein